ncbi:MAG: gamma-glutamyl-gamma-aminobutyrate hydrolase family protein [Planctomycetota bacterium]
MGISSESRTGQVGRPLRIGINCSVDLTGRAAAKIYLEYVDFVADAGGVPVLLPPVASALQLASECDGFLLIGGDDYRLSCGPTEPPGFLAMAPRREEFDLELGRRVLTARKPTLGVCAGFQLLALLEGGELYGDLATELPSDILHRVESNGTDGASAPPLMHGLHWHACAASPEVATGRYLVNSCHHQGIKRLPASWRSFATTDDELIEGAVGPGPFLVGVQWHPEREPTSVLSVALMKSLLAAARQALPR